MADGERVPVRLVQENGNTISLDATSIDMVSDLLPALFLPCLPPALASA